MNIYTYIGQNQPLAIAILEQFGYKPVGQDMGENLRQLVASEGEKALKVIVANHPDKDLILDIYQTDKKPCPKCEEKKRFEEYLNASGNNIRNESRNEQIKGNNDVLYLAGVIILALAIMKIK